MNAADRLDQVRLPHAVNLQVLPRGQPQVAVAQLVAKIEVRQELLAGKSSGGNDRAEHEAVGRLPGGLARLAQVPPLVAIVLLIDAVLPQQLRGLVAEVVASVGQLLDIRPRRPSLSSLIVSTRLSCGEWTSWRGQRKTCARVALALPVFSRTHWTDSMPGARRPTSNRPTKLSLPCAGRGRRD